MGVWGLCFFIVGYARCRKDLRSEVIESVVAFSISTAIARNLPCSSALLRSLAEKEAELLQSFREGVFGRHYAKERTI
jgi:hypothetical protein